MSGTISLNYRQVLSPRPKTRHAWDLVGIPFRMVLFPDRWNQRLGWSSLEEERLRAVLPTIQGRLLDIGAGANNLVNLYPGEGIGVDIHDFGGGAMIVEDTRNLPFATGSFDTVTLIACLNHIPYRADALREAHRLLRPGGKVVLTMINRLLGGIGHKLWWYGEDRHRGGMAEGETGGLDVAEVRELLSSAGFQDVRLRRFCYGLNVLYQASKTSSDGASKD